MCFIELSDITKEKLHEQQLDVIVALSSTVSVASSLTPLSDALAAVVRLLVERFEGFDFGALFVAHPFVPLSPVTGEGSEMTLAACHGIGDHFVAELEQAICSAGHAMHHKWCGRPFRVGQRRVHVATLTVDVEERAIARLLLGSSKGPPPCATIDLFQVSERLHLFR